MVGGEKEGVRAWWGREGGCESMEEGGEGGYESMVGGRRA